MMRNKKGERPRAARKKVPARDSLERLPFEEDVDPWREVFDDGLDEYDFDKYEGLHDEFDDGEPEPSSQTPRTISRRRA